MPTPRPAQPRADEGCDALERGREAFARRGWADAFVAFTSAEERSLEVVDVERLAVAAYLVGEDASSMAAWERAHRGWLAVGDVDRAVRCAFWVAFTLLLRGELAPAGGWLARAAELVGRSPAPCAGRGYLMVPAVLRALDEGDASGADGLSREVGEIATALDVADLHAFSLLGRGQAATVLGDVERAGLLFDAAMVVVTTDEVSPVVAGIVYCAVIES